MAGPTFPRRFIANIAQNLSVGITAFLDILGFGDRILSAQTTADIDAVVADIRTIPEFFEFKPKDKHIKISPFGLQGNGARFF